MRLSFGDKYMWFIYGKDGQRIVVDEPEHTEKLNSGEWFPTPMEALNSKLPTNENIKIRKTKKAE